MFVPYLALPTKLETALLPTIRLDPVTPSAGDTIESYATDDDAEIAAGVEADMQRTLTGLADGRVPFLGRVRRRKRR